MRTRLLALFTAAALVVGACGSDSDDPADETTTTSEVESPVTTGGTSTSTPDGEGGTFGDLVPAVEEESARFEGRMVAVGSPGSQLTEPLEVLVSGALDPERQAVRISMDMSAVARSAFGGGEMELPPQFAEMFEEPMEIVTIGGSAWLRFPLLAMVTGADTDWVEVPPDEAGGLASQLGLRSQVTSPTGLLDQLREARAEVEEVGTEDVRGVGTTHYRVQVDLSALADTMPEAEREQFRQEFGEADALPVEVWVGDDGRLHRYRVDLTEAGGASEEVESASVEFEFFDHGSDVDIEAPPEDQVTPMEELQGLPGGPGAGEGTGG